MKQVKELDFSGQNIFCGIDVHKRSWKVSIRTDKMELKSFSQNPSVMVLGNFLKTNYPRANYKVVYEAGFCGFGYQREFTQQGIKCIIVHPADVPTMDKEKQRKSDVVDCRKLSKTLSDNSLTGIFIPGVEQQDDRAVVRTYHQLVKDQTRYKNRIKGWLNFQGIVLPEEDDYKYWSKNFIKWLKAVPLTTVSARTSLDLLIGGLEQARHQVLLATRQLRELSTQDRHCLQIKLLRTIPGIGLVTAIILLTEIGDINRFVGLDPLCDYIGLVPKIYASDQTQHVMGLTHRGNYKLREAIIEASWTAIRKDPALTMAYSEYIKRMNKNKAIIKIARKLINRIRFVMKNQKEYQPAVVQ
jgi:transposase